MQPGLNLNNLKYFYDAVETESISEAARRNHVTQSAVSQGILKLERALNLSLITHQKNLFKLTSEGQSIFFLTQGILRSLKEMTDIVKEKRSVVSGEVNIACTQSIAINLIAQLLQRVKAEYPRVKINIKTAKMENIYLMLKRGAMDFAIVVESNLCDQFDKQILQKGYFQLYAKNIKEEDLHKGIYVDHVNGLCVNQLGQNYRKRFKKNLTILQELDSWQVLAKCAQNDMGWCFLPDFLMTDQPFMQIFKGLNPIAYNIVAIYPKGVRLTRAAISVLKEIE